jgi:GNAT superfamily N-acetyltransferase
MGKAIPTSISININGKDENLDIDVAKPKKYDDMPGTGAWYKWHDVALLLKGELIGRLVLETIGLTENRPAWKAFSAIDRFCQSDWEIPLECFDEHHITAQLWGALNIIPKGRSSQQVMINEVSILPEYRNKGLARALVKHVALLYPKSQAIWLIIGPLEKPAYVGKNKFKEIVHSADNPNKEGLINVYDKYGFSILGKKTTHCGKPLMISTPSRVNSSCN